MCKFVSLVTNLFWFVYYIVCENFDEFKMQASSSKISNKKAITNIAAAARDLLLPAKFRHLYEESYSAYQKWCSE